MNGGRETLGLQWRDFGKASKGVVAMCVCVCESVHLCMCLNICTHTQ